MAPTYFISIVTSTLNCADALKQTCESIKSQQLEGVQWIVADGASSDGTLALIKANSGLITDWISAPDTGIYNAWNKAVHLIKGEWVIFLGAGDLFAEATTLAGVMEQLKALPESVVIAYGNVTQAHDEHVSYRLGEVDLAEWEAYRPRLPPHQGVFQRASLFATPQPFDESYRVVADSKFLLQALGRGTLHYLDQDVCQMMPGGVSSHPRMAVKVMHEFLRLEQELGYRIPVLRRARYIALSRLKYLIFQWGGSRLMDRLLRIKYWGRRA